MRHRGQAVVAPGEHLEHVSWLGHTTEHAFAHPFFSFPQVQLAHIFGPENIPDVEFVVSTRDDPHIPLVPGVQPVPVFRQGAWERHACWAC